MGIVLGTLGGTLQALGVSLCGGVSAVFAVSGSFWGSWGALAGFLKRSSPQDSSKGQKDSEKCIRRPHLGGHVGVWEAILGVHAVHLGFWKAHVADLGGHLVAKRAAKSQHEQTT